MRRIRNPRNRSNNEPHRPDRTTGAFCWLLPRNETGLESVRLKSLTPTRTQRAVRTCLSAMPSRLLRPVLLAGVADVLTDTHST